MVQKRFGPGRLRGRSSRNVRTPRDVVAYHKGNKTVIPNHPPEFMSRPWFPLIVRIDNPATTLTYGQLHQGLLTQLGFGAATNNLAVRLRTLRFWGPIPVTSAPVIISINDVFVDITVSSANGILEMITDYPDMVNRARVGYRYSTAQSSRSIILTSTSTLPISTMIGLGPGSVCYVSLLWRVQAIASNNNADSDTDSEVEVLSRQLSRINSKSSRK